MALLRVALLTPLLLCVLLCACGRAVADVPPFAGDVMPVPPQQNAPWTPPAGAPSDLVAMTQTLYQYGLADPRGCEYRAFSVRVHEFSDHRVAAAVHGWLLPGEGKKNRFAVCWNGLIYPVLDILGTADLQADLQAKLDDPDDRHYGSVAFHAPGEYASLKIPPLTPQAACLLLRLGLQEEATRLWQAFARSKPKDDPLVFVAGVWLWTWTYRALQAHVSGDDRLALLDARSLRDVAPALEALARARVPQTPRWRELMNFEFRFLPLIPLLLADQERRAGERGQAPPADKTAALIASLENAYIVTKNPWDAADFANEETVKALVAQGEAAVPALLDALENDHRLTRSVSFDRYDFPDRRIYTVAEAALFALRAIFNNYPFGEERQLKTPAERVAQAARARQFWERQKDLKPAERWYFLLRDDSAGPEQWALAADKMTDRLAEGGPMVGEELRANRQPPVSALMAQRVNDSIAIAKKAHYTQSFAPLRHAGEIARFLSYWDKNAAPPVLKDYFAQAGDFLAHPPPEWSQRFAEFREKEAGANATVADGYNRCASELARVLNTHLNFVNEVAEAPILDEYAAWLRASVQGPLWMANSEELDNVFVLLSINPGHKGLAVAAEALFASKDSPFNPWLPPSQPAGFSSPVDGVALTIPAFRRMVLRQLENTEVIGKTRGDDILLDKWQVFLRWNRDKWQPMRVCDLYAFYLTFVHYAPPFAFEWPQVRRDAAIRAGRVFLHRFGAQFRIADSATWGYHPVELPPSVAPRVATAQDVARGSAIFALSGPEAKRVAPVKLPQYAKCRLNGALHEGSVWQAEEVLQGGKWQRFYGFSGDGLLLKVPASDVTLSPTR